MCIDRMGVVAGCVAETPEMGEISEIVKALGVFGDGCVFGLVASY